MKPIGDALVPSAGILLDALTRSGALFRQDDGRARVSAGAQRTSTCRPRTLERPDASGPTVLQPVVSRRRRNRVPRERTSRTNRRRSGRFPRGGCRSPRFESDRRCPGLRVRGAVLGAGYEDRRRVKNQERSRLAEAGLWDDWLLVCSCSSFCGNSSKRSFELASPACSHDPSPVSDARVKPAQAFGRTGDNSSDIGASPPSDLGRPVDKSSVEYHLQANVPPVSQEDRFGARVRGVSGPSARHCRLWRTTCEELYA